MLYLPVSSCNLSRHLTIDSIEFKVTMLSYNNNGSISSLRFPPVSGLSIIDFIFLTNYSSTSSLSLIVITAESIESKNDLNYFTLSLGSTYSSLDFSSLKIVLMIFLWKAGIYFSIK